MGRSSTEETGRPAFVEGYFLAQKVSPQWGHSSSTSEPKNKLTFRDLPVLRYAVTDTGSPQPSHGLVVNFCHRSRSHSCIPQTYTPARRSDQFSVARARLRASFLVAHMSCELEGPTPRPVDYTPADADNRHSIPLDTCRWKILV